MDNEKPTSKDASSTSFAELFFRLGKNCVLLVARFYVMCILIAFDWLAKIAAGAFKPLEPIKTQVKKVPKKDVSVEGIFYQFLRLQFLLVLYVLPFFQNALSYVTGPLVRLRGWAIEFVDNTEEPKSRTVAQD